MTGFTAGKCIQPIAGCKMHAHAGWEVVLTLSGSGTETIGALHQPFAPGAIVCIPPNVMHDRSGDGMFEDIHICFADGEPIFDGGTQSAQDDEFGTVRKLMELIHYAWFRDEKRPSAGTCQLASAMVQILKERIPQSAENPFAARIRRRIIQRFDDPEFSLAAELDAAPYCADYLRRLFRAAYRTTPQQYLLRLRLEKAEELLRASPTDISAVAAQCGFYDAHYFARLFRERYGCTPSAYRARSGGTLVVF